MALRLYRRFLPTPSPNRGYRTGPERPYGMPKAALRPGVNLLHGCGRETTQDTQNEPLIVREQIFALDDRVEPESGLLPLCSGHVNDQLCGSSNSAMPTTGNERQNGIVEALIPRIRLHNKRWTDLTPCVIPVREVYYHHLTTAHFQCCR